jgi:hypothetical protein
MGDAGRAGAALPKGGPPGPPGSIDNASLSGELGAVREPVRLRSSLLARETHTGLQAAAPPGNLLCH